MNETNFVNYDTYFCSSNNQMLTTENSLLPTTLDYDMAQTGSHNFMTSGSCDLPLASSTIDTRRVHSACYPYHAQSREDHERGKDPVPCPPNAAANNAPANSVFPNIPFVQIHTTDVQPQRTSYGNVFRRNISKQEEIKSEPIKSESADGAKDRINATPTPPRAPSASQSQHIDETQATDAISEPIACQSDQVANKNTHQIYKCLKCPYLALTEDAHNNHTAVHGSDTESVDRTAINCPGCSNVFYVHESLEMHLNLDHQMSRDDAAKLSKSLSNVKDLDPNIRIQPAEVSPGLAKENASNQQPQRKSRIYLKNVDCLREPNRQPIEQTENQLSENTCQSSSAIKEVNPPPKQKISIKSVDVLREPALLRRDNELKNASFNNFIHVGSNLNEQMPLNIPATYDFSQTTDSLISNTCTLNTANGLSLIDANVKSTQDEEKSRRPKIYVKSVESFNLMPLEPIHNGLQNNEFIPDPLNVCGTATANDAYNNDVSHLHFMYDPNHTANNVTSTGNFISNHNNMDATYQFISNPTTATTFMMDTPMCCNVHMDGFNLNVGQMENVALPSAPTPPSVLPVAPVIPAPPVEGLFDMNKSPHPIQEHRGTLHLRTVDELNLMNKNEVQHLIAPQLDNNHNSESCHDLDQSIEINNADFIGDALYQNDHFKFQDLDSQMVNDWSETYEDLAHDIGGILTDVAAEAPRDNPPNNSEKLEFGNLNVDTTPQVSLITIRDIEELTGVCTSAAVVPFVPVNNSNQQLPDPMDVSQNNLVVSDQIENISITQNITLNLTNASGDNSENLKRELSNSTPDTSELPTLAVVETPVNIPVSAPIESNVIASTECTNKSLPELAELPPLLPVTNEPTSSVPQVPLLADSNANSEERLPPLVPVPPLIKINKTLSKPPPSVTSPVEKGRIYVANNLMEVPKRPVAVSATSGTSVRGRPFGSNRTRITQLKQQHGSSAEDMFVKCSYKGCAFRFKSTETLEYHGKCHDVASSNPQATICPECKSKDFKNWNTLHTHLWRVHQIDMELYKCELCDFKTPIFSRLANTHAKIHFDDRNYKCEQCGKSFKNSKQLKNHRRWHRVQATSGTLSPKDAVASSGDVHRCNDCGSTFSQQRSLKEHCCKKSESSLKCQICEKVMSTKASLKLHLLTHSDGEKRHKCQQCEYATNDHNSFRRHRMGHENKKMYDCQFCDYKSVQSVAYQKHVQQKHPEHANSVIHKCSGCSFTTINRSLLRVHQAKHSNEKVSPSKEDSSIQESVATNVHESNKQIIHPSAEVQKSKIKVKSNLFTTPG